MCLVLCMIFSCNEQEDTVNLASDDKLDFASISKELKEGLYNFGENMRSQGKSFTNESDLISMSSLVDDKDFEIAFQNNYEKALLYVDNKARAEQERTSVLVVPQYEYEKFVQIDQLWRESERVSDYTTGLTALLQEIENNTDEFPELSTFIISQIVAYEFIEDNPDLFDLANGSGNWWSDWGKCAAGIAGGVLTGGVVGAGIGAAPGAIGGGLTGASASCDGNKKKGKSCQGGKCPVQYVAPCSEEHGTAEQCIEQQIEFIEGEEDEAYPLFDLGN